MKSRYRYSCGVLVTTTTPMSEKTVLISVDVLAESIGLAERAALCATRYINVEMLHLDSIDVVEVKRCDKVYIES